MGWFVGAVAIKFVPGLQCAISCTRVVGLQGLFDFAGCFGGAGKPVAVFTFVDQSSEAAG